MDTSKEYVDMCRKAKEIQALAWEENNCWDSKSFLFADIPNVWLPRQDQLQNMIDGNWCVKLLKCNDFILTDRFIKSVSLSLEQVWLLFVMKEKYNKEWIKGGWK